MIKPLYFDTSAATKLFFRNERGSAELTEFLRAFESFILRSSALMQIEMYSVVRRKLLEAGRTPESFYEEIQVWREYETRRFSFVPLDEPNLQRVRELVIRAPAQVQLRSLDFIHLSACLLMKARYPDTLMVTSDKKMIAGARLLGLPVFDPENPGRMLPAP